MANGSTRANVSIPFALFSLWVLRNPLDVYSIFGLFMAFGIVKKNGILQIDYTNTLRAESVERGTASSRPGRASSEMRIDLGGLSGLIMAP